LKDLNGRFPWIAIKTFSLIYFRICGLRISAYSSRFTVHALHFTDMTITIKDETFAGKILREINLQFESEQVTVKDIITQRVLQEVENYNKKLPEFYNGLVEPTDAERTLNGFRLKAKRLIDGEKQVFIALDAFLKNAFFVLIDNTQSESLEQEVLLSKSTNVSFVKLTPLVGG
jgi:hypothetical protein